MDLDFQNELQKYLFIQEKQSNTKLRWLLSRVLPIIPCQYRTYQPDQRIGRIKKSSQVQTQQILSNFILIIQDQQCYSSFQRNQKAKRFRRNAHEIQRFYKCSVKSCAKSYGSQGSLNQHYKLKHPEIYASLPNVQSVFGQKSPQPESESDKKQLTNDFRNSNSKLNSILKELGDMRSFNNIKIDELRFDYTQNKENKQNQCLNIPERIDFKDGMSSKKQFLTFIKKEESIITDDGNQKLKRSSRTIKKRDFNF